MSPRALRSVSASLAIWLTLSLGSALARPRKPAQKPQKPRENLSELSLEVTALQALHDLQPTQAQLTSLAKIASETAPKPGPRTPGKTSPKYARTLHALHDALLKGNQELIDDLGDKLSELREAENPRLDDDVAMTDAARKHAGGALRLFTARQIAEYAGEYGDGLPEPRTVLLDAIGGISKIPADKWPTARDEMAEELGYLTAGVDASRASRAAGQMRAFLDRVQRLDEAGRKSQRPALEKEVDKLLEGLGPIEVLRNLVEFDLAVLLSNPELPSAIQLYSKRAAK